MEQNKQLLQGVIKNINGKLIAVASDESLDREGEVLKVEDWDLENYKKNPVILGGHVYQPEYVVGISQNTRIEDGKLLIEPLFHDITEYARGIKKMIEEGFLKTFSVGYLTRKDGKNELLEVSVVPVPANPQAMTLTMKSITNKDAEKIKQWIKQVITKPAPDMTENYIRIRVRDPDDFDSESFRTIDISTEEGIKAIVGCPKGKYENGQCSVGMEIQSYLFDKDKWTVAGAEKWVEEHKAVAEEIEVKGVIPFKETPKAPEDEEWDAGKEVKEAEVEDLKIMCAWFDSENPDIKTSYKLPHHKASGGHPVVWRGVAAAMGVLLGARGGVKIPETDKKGVYNHLVKHYAQFDKEPPEFRSYTEEELEKMFSEEQKGMKEGRVISEKNRELISETIDELEDLIKQIKRTLSPLKELLMATESTKQIDLDKDNFISELLKKMENATSILKGLIQSKDTTPTKGRGERDNDHQQSLFKIVDKMVEIILNKSKKDNYLSDEERQALALANKAVDSLLAKVRKGQLLKRETYGRKSS